MPFPLKTSSISNGRCQTKTKTIQKIQKSKVRRFQQFAFDLFLLLNFYAKRDVLPNKLNYFHAKNCLKLPIFVINPTP